jgi:methionine-rich copper-binding protein CopC
LIGLLAAMTFAGTASAHTPIIAVVWDNPASPTKLMGLTDGNQISNAPGTFFLRLYDAAGMRVDLDDAVVMTSNTQIMVSVPPGLPAGSYTVQWLTTAADGDEDSGTLTISIAGAAAPAQAPAPAATAHDDAAVAEGHDGAAVAHTHEAGDDTHEAAAAGHEHEAMSIPVAAMPAKPVAFEVKLLGSNEVPPVSTTAIGTAKLIFYPATKQLDMTLGVVGVSASQLTGAHVHRGGPKENGPHVFDLINDSFAAVGGTAVLSDSAVRDLLAGNLYINVHSKEFPAGLLRGQLSLAPAAHDDHAHDEAAHAAPARASITGVQLPRAGDGGLATDMSLTPLFAAAAILVGLSGVVAGGLRAGFGAYRTQRKQDQS